LNREFLGSCKERIACLKLSHSFHFSIPLQLQHLHIVCLHYLDYSCCYRSAVLWNITDRSQIIVDIVLMVVMIMMVMVTMKLAEMIKELVCFIALDILPFFTMTEKT